MDTNGELIFDSLDLIEIPVKIAGKDYVLIEADEDKVAKYRNAISRTYKTKTEGAGEVREMTSEGLADTESYLLSMCLFQFFDGKRVSVPKEVIKKWPHRVSGKLFDKLEEISGLSAKKDEKTEAERKEQAKNSQPATT
jgi:hypothetical protein